LVARKGIDVERAREQLDPALVGVPVGSTPPATSLAPAAPAAQASPPDSE
jgi:hypothetical protein